MKAITAFVHHVRASAVVEALAEAGFRQLSLHEVKGMLGAITERERDFSTDTAGRSISEVQLTLFVEDADVDRAVALIRSNARVGDHVSGHVFVSVVERSIVID